MWEVAQPGSAQCTMCTPMSGRPTYANVNRTACTSVAESCPPGKQMVPGSPGCHDCPLNTFSTGGSGSWCQPCPADMLSRRGATSAADCYPDPARWGSGCARSDGVTCVETNCDHATQSVVIWNDYAVECFTRQAGMTCPFTTALHHWRLDRGKDDGYWRFLVEVCVRAGYSRDECVAKAGKQVIYHTSPSGLDVLLAPRVCRPCNAGDWPNSAGTARDMIGGFPSACYSCISNRVPTPLPQVCGE